MTDWDSFKAGIMGLIIVSLLAAAAAIALDSFQADLGGNACPTGFALNLTSRVCCNTTAGTSCVNAAGYTDSINGSGGTAAFNSTQEGLIGTLNATTYLSTIGTLIGVAMLIAIVVGAFYFVAQR